jgi:coenzyme F420-dependent glucose-6-phosphate dehydrogenase
MSTIRFGYTLSSEEHPPNALVENALRAEAAGFDFVSISDHFHPWTRAQGHSPFVWTVLGALAQATHRIRVGVGVTCPILRIHPVVLAQATATTSLVFGDRFFWGVRDGRSAQRACDREAMAPARSSAGDARRGSRRHSRALVR